MAKGETKSKRLQLLMQPSMYEKLREEETGRWRLPESLRCRGRGLIDVCRSDLVHAERV